MIFWFSGTGNSRWVATRLGEMIDDPHIYSMAELLVAGKLAFTLQSNERVGFVFPTYSWGPAPVVDEFLAHIQIQGYTAGSNYCCAVTTCGDDVGLSHQIMAKAAARVGLHLDAMFSVTMPNNYVCLPGFDTDPHDLEQRKLKAAADRMAMVGEAIAERRCTVSVTPGGMPWLKSRVIRPLFKRLLMSPRKFGVDSSACTRCGICSRVCPMHNVSAASASALPEWGSRCAMCLACYHHCPAHAVHYGGATRGKRQYFLGHK